LSSKCVALFLKWNPMCRQKHSRGQTMPAGTEEALVARETATMERESRMRFWHAYSIRFSPRSRQASAPASASRSCRASCASMVAKYVSVAHREAALRLPSISGDSGRAIGDASFARYRTRKPEPGLGVQKSVRATKSIPARNSASRLRSLK
jgi:hypothetical protein